MNWLEWFFQDPNRDIAFGTLLLAAFALLQWRETRKTAKRQLRAYLSMVPKAVNAFGTKERIEIEFWVINHGLTPARKINHVFEIDVIPAAEEKNIELSEPTSHLETETTMFPRDELRIWFRKTTVLTDNEVRDIESGASQLRIWGKTTYKDVFGDLWRTEFNGFVCGARFAEHIKAIRQGKRGDNIPTYNWMYGRGHGNAS